MNNISDKEPRKQKKCYSIDEVSEMFGLNEWTIRMWCNRFDILKCSRDEKGDMVFYPENVRMIGMICYLIKTKGIKLTDVKKYLAEGGNIK